MKLYADATGTYCRRVIVYLAEKYLHIERVNVDTALAEHKTPVFLAKNPAGLIPVLELDNGSYLPESSAIVEYLEEVYPLPSMIGDTPEMRAKVRALERIGNDLSVLCAAAGRTKHEPAVATGLRPLIDQQLAVLEHYIEDKPFLAADRPTIADVTLFSLFETFRVKFKLPFGQDYARLNAWYDRFKRRPSAAW